MGLLTPPPSAEPAEPEAMSTAVTGPGGTVFLDCGTVERIDAHIKRLMFQIGAHSKWPKRVSDHWQDVDVLLERRFLITLEEWLSPSDMPL